MNLKKKDKTYCDRAWEVNSDDELGTLTNRKSFLEKLEQNLVDCSVYKKTQIRLKKLYRYNVSMISPN